MAKADAAGVAPDEIERTPKSKAKKWADPKPKGKRTAATRGRATSVRASRETESRAATAVHDDFDAPWVQPSSLQAPPALSGMVQRWIRVGSKGKDDAVNLSRKLREGWQPRPADTVPKSFAMPAIKKGEFAGCIGVEGMILMHMPKARNQQRNAHYERRKGRMTESINAQLAEASKARGRGSGFGAIEKASSTKFVRERLPVVAED